LDLYLGAGNERRTAELAGQLEQIHRERNDQVNADRFAELRQRFQKAAGVSPEELQAAPPMAAPVESLPAAPVAPETQARASVETASEGAVPVDQTAELSAAEIAAEFGIPLTGAPPEPVVEEFAVAPIPLEEPAISVEAPPPQQPIAQTPPAASGEELDLSDEWEAISQEVVDAEKTALEETPAAAGSESEPAIAESEQEAAPAPEPEPEPVFIIEESEPEAVIEEMAVQPEPVELEPEAPIALEIEAEPEAVPASANDSSVQPDSFEIQESSEEADEIPTIEIIEEPDSETLAAEPVTAANGEFELELTPEPSSIASHAGPATTEDFLNELAAEVEDLEAPPADRAFASAAKNIDEPVPVSAASSVPAAAISENGSSKSSAVPEITTESLNELAEVFQEFRSELGELGEEDEDLETHYNLGIAYREMGLLDEAIGEFQKVAKAVQKGKPFRYTMNCSTMLGLSFMDKGEPNIAALWYQRALEVPGLEHETILALRYDLGLALEAGGDSSAALDCFRQVYAANIEYRDVADRISTLQKR
jgi:tetratricopeptide (TPR) repeat protein